jgi:hypothetical protein
MRFGVKDRTCVCHNVSQLHSVIDTNTLSICAVQHLQSLHTLVGKHIDAVHRNLASVLPTEELCAFDEIFDLAAIKFQVRQLLQRVFIDVELVSPRALDKICPDLKTSVAGKIVIWQEQIHSRLERVIDIGDAISREE